VFICVDVGSFELVSVRLCFFVLFCVGVLMCVVLRCVVMSCV
jgi:hypothetical protein